ncbi:MAG: UbiD family decarboxylase [Alphaproteobacteria bacterium]|nr:UbiD family decarboxylase [Alphaproteobacteria bacterium]
MAKSLRDIVPGGKSASNLQAVLPYKDLRQWLEEAKKLGEVVIAKGLGVEEEIGAAAEMVMQRDDAPCVVFDEIPGYPKGHRVLVNFFGGKRKNMTLGFPTELSKIDLSEAYYSSQIKELPSIPHVIVESGPVTENIKEGDAIDVTAFPAPMWHPADGGRYLGTGSYDVTIDPDSRWMNLGTYRVMVMDKKTVGFYISPGKHGRVHRDKWMARGEPMPAVIVCGGDPMTFLAACTEMPQGQCEYDIVGGMRGEALKCIKGKYTGIPFPADAEIVIEGFVDPRERRPEGPFGEWTGYYGSDMRDEPVMHVKAVYHRNNPIILGCPPQRPPDEMCRYRAITRSAMLRSNVEKAGVPDVAAAWAHEVGNARMLLGIAIRQRYPGHAKQAGHVAAMCHVGAYAGKYVVVTDEDIDVSNLEELTWAMLTRSDPATSIDIIHGAWSTPLDPRIPPDEKKKGNMTNSRAIIDACRPFHWRNEFPKVNAPSPEEARRARERFGYLLEGKDKP